MRLGSIRYINSLPVDLGLLSRAIPLEAEIVQGTPADLNQGIIRGELEVSPVSAFWYARHQKDFLLLPDLSISSESGVQSVLLFSRYAMKELAGREIAVTEEGRTTPVLLEILCRARFGFKPNLKTVTAPFENIFSEAPAVLLIGDEALMAKERLKDSDIRVFDLAEEWRAWTKLPIVFAVWVTRRETFLKQPDLVIEIHKAILRSKAWGLDHKEEILKKAVEQAKLSYPTLSSYFSGLSYDFTDNLKKGMRRYFEEAAKCGLLQGAVNFEEIGEAVVTK